MGEQNKSPEDCYEFDLVKILSIVYMYRKFIYISIFIMLLVGSFFAYRVKPSFERNYKLEIAPVNLSTLSINLEEEIKMFNLKNDQGIQLSKIAERMYYFMIIDVSDVNVNNKASKFLDYLQVFRDNLIERYQLTLNNKLEIIEKKINRWEEIQKNQKSVRSNGKEINKDIDFIISSTPYILKVLEDKDKVELDKLEISNLKFDVSNVDVGGKKISPLRKRLKIFITFLMLGLIFSIVSIFVYQILKEVKKRVGPELISNKV